MDFLADTCGFYEKAVKNLEKKHSFSVVDLVSGTVDYLSKEHKSQVRLLADNILLWHRTL